MLMDASLRFEEKNYGMPLSIAKKFIEMYLSVRWSDVQPYEYFASVRQILR